MYKRYSRLRDEHGLTDYKVAQECGFSRATLSRWKNGESEPGSMTIVKLAEYFDVSADYLMGLSDFENIQLPDDAVFYTDPEIAKFTQDLYENHDLRLLFEAALDATPKQVKLLYMVLQEMTGKDY